MKKLSTLLPAMRWIPHDIESPTTTKKEREKERPKLSLLGWKGTPEPYHGALKRRKSAVSLNSQVDEELDVRTHMQGQSMFFAMLPLEVRKMVYEFAVGREVVHLVFARRRFGHFVCERGEEGDGECGCTVMVGGGRSRRLSGAGLRMLGVCRRMYTEAVSHLYTPHTFSLLHITHLLYLPSHIPQARLNSIRSLRLKWTIRGMPYFRRHASSKRPAYPEDTANWEKAWDIIARMRGLRDLTVVILDPSPDGIWEPRWLGVEEELMKGVARVRVRKGVVVLPYRSCRIDWDLGDSGIRLARPSGEEGEGDGEGGED